MTVAEEPIVVSIIDPRETLDGTPPATDGRERRASERAISYWGKKIAQLGGSPTIAALDLAALDSEEWSSRFVMTIDPLLDGSSLLLYGADVARLLNLPPGSKARVPIMRRLPARYVPVFRRGCAAVMQHNAAVRVEGQVDCEDGQQELFRAIIIPVGEGANQAVRFAFGAISCRLS